MWRLERIGFVLVGFTLCVTTVLATPTVPDGYAVEKYATGIGAAGGPAFSPDGVAYFTDYQAGQVLRRTASGGLEVFLSNLPLVGALAFSPTGRMFVLAADLGIFEIVNGAPDASREWSVSHINGDKGQPD